jgi:hypothetical protein
MHYSMRVMKIHRDDERRKLVRLWMWTWMFLLLMSDLYELDVERREMVRRCEL